MGFHASGRHVKADYAFMMHVPESGCWFYVFEQLSLLKSIPKRASERLNEHSHPHPTPPPPSCPLQPSSHLLSNVLVFISRLNKCLFLQHARTHAHTHTHDDFSHPMNLSEPCNTSYLKLHPLFCWPGWLRSVFWYCNPTCRKHKTPEIPYILESNPHPNLIRTSFCRFLERKKKS